VFHIGACFAAFAPPLITSLTEHQGWSFAQSIATVAGALQLTLAVALVLRPKTVFESGAREAAPAPGLSVPEPV
jgi:hypothetical protein